MSWSVSEFCVKRCFGSPVRKQIIMYLADKASDDGSGIWCSKATIAHETELGFSTVKKAIYALVAEGILNATGKKRCDYGYTTVYEICLEAVGRLEKLGPANAVRSLVARPYDGGALTDCTLRSGEGQSAVSERAPNHPKTIHKPPAREGVAEVADQEFETIWAAFPSDRRRGRAACLEVYRSAISEGYSAAELRKVVQSYAQESEGFTRSKVSFSDNWFRQGRWRERVEVLRAQQDEASESLNAELSRLATWVSEGSALCRHITPKQARELVARGMVASADLARTGLAS